jgi:putative holliday junction resolvase
VDARTSRLFEIVDADAAADAVELLAHPARGVGTVVEVSDHSDHQRQDGCGTGTDQGDGRALAGGLAELVRDQKAHAKTHRRLGEGDDAGDGQIFPKLFERDRRHGIADRRFVVWDFQLQMETRRFLGVDPGEARVGVAISDDLGLLAHPLETIEVRRTNPLDRLAQLVGDRQVLAVVVGVPRNMDGSFGPSAEKARAFIAALRERVSCRVVPWDERLTTVSAQRALQEAGRKAREQKKIIDQAAAQILLQSWLDASGGV